MIEYIIKYWVEFMFTITITGVLYIFKQYIGIKNGMISLLRNEIVRIYDIQNSLLYCPSYIKKNIKEMYDSYHKLGGNGMISVMVKDLYELPSEIREELYEGKDI